VRKELHILRKWREWTCKRKQGCRLLALAIERTVKKDAFDVVRNTARKDLLAERELRATTAINKLGDRWFKRASFNKWRAELYQKAKHIEMKVSTLTQRAVQKHDYRTNKIEDYQEYVKMFYGTKDLTRECFKALRAHCQAKR
jgi:hypothetical protein